jgi:hypothetical protein
MNVKSRYTGNNPKTGQPKKRESKKMDEVMTALRDLDLEPELVHTGGGLMVAFIALSETRSIGVDEYSVCLYENYEEIEAYVDETEDDQERIANLARQAQALKLMNDFMANGVPFWNAFCECKQHKGQAFTRVPKGVVLPIAMKLQVDPFTNKGAKAINKAILHGVN